MRKIFFAKLFDFLKIGDILRLKVDVVHGIIQEKENQMKIRHGFVSNSSSCSFTIKLGALTPVQLALIKNHRSFAQWMRDENILPEEDAKRGECICEKGDEWDIKVDTQAGILEAFTIMDNFDLIWFANSIGVNHALIKVEGSNY